MFERWWLLFSYFQRRRVLLARKFVFDGDIWVFSRIILDFYFHKLQRWTVSFSCLKHPLELLVGNIVFEAHIWVFFIWISLHALFSYVRALNVTIFAHSTPKCIIGKEFRGLSPHMSFFSWFKLYFRFPYVTALMATIFLL